jgi:autotransporter-associated beta strand protein
MAPPASAQLFTSTTSTGNWFNTTGTAGRWATTSSGPFGSNYVSGSNTSFTTAGTYTFDRLTTTGSATLGNITTVNDVNISFTTSTGQQLNFNGAGGAVRTLDFGAGSVVDFGSIATIAGNGFVKDGAGTLVLTGGAYTGGMTLNAGNVIARGANAFGTGALTINGGKIGTTNVFTAPARTGGSILVGNDFQIGIADSPALSSANMTFSNSGNGLNLNNGARRITLGSSGSMTFGQVISNGSLTLARNADGANGSFGLSGNNTFSGLTIDDVAVNVSGQNAVLGAGSVTLTGASAATLNIKSNLTIGNDITIADSAGTKTITNSGGNATIQGTIFNNDSTGGLVIGAASGRIFTIGDIGGSGSEAVRFGGSGLSGAVVVNGAGTYTGNTVIDGSTVRLSGANASVSAANLVFQQTAGSTVPTFDLNGQEQTVAGLDDSAVAGIIRSTLSGGKLIVGDSNNSTFQGTIISANSMALEKVGTGKLTLTGANTYTNGTTITGGELEVSSQSLKGDVNIGDVINANAKLTFNQAFGDGTFSGDIFGVGSLTKNGNDALTLTGANSYSGGTTVSAGDLIGSTDALQGDIVNDATVTFRQAADGTYAGNMSGTGALVKTGVANVTLGGVNTYGGGTTISAGGLTATTGSLPTNGNVVADAGTTLTFDQGTNGSFGGVLSGDGALVKLGAGAVTLTGANTYTGGNTITAGNLIGSTSSIQGDVAVDTAAALTIAESTDASFTGAISGAGALVKTLGGNVTLTGANTYTGGTTVSAGGLTGTIESLQGDIVTAASTTVTFDQAADGEYAGVLSGAGKLVKDGAGVLTVTGANSYGGNTEVLAGSLVGKTTNVLGNIAVSSGANVSFDQTVPGTVSGNVTGDGSLSILGSGEITLAGTNTYGGGTTVTGGTLVGTTSSIQGNIVNDAAVTINGAGTYAGVMSGGGTLTKAGAGDLTLSGANSYSGGTTVSGGNLIGTTTSLTGDIAVSGTSSVVFNQASTGTFLGNVSGVGGLIKTGAGSVTLDSDQSYTGATAVNGGTLLLSGNLSTSGITVDSGATLGGTGSLTGGSANLNVNGNLNPGDAVGPGSLEAAGITLGSTSLTTLNLVNDGSGGSGTAGTDYSTVIARGNLVLDGNLVIRFDNSSLYNSYSYFDLFQGTIDFTANSNTGFAGITTEGSGPYSGLTFTYFAAGSGNPGGWATQDAAGTPGQYLIFQPSTGTLVIVPEPSTWAMTLASVGFAGWMARRKKLARKRRMA